MRWSCPLEDAVAGTTVKIRVPTWVSCSTCGGSGAKPGTSAQDLPHLPGCRTGAHAAGLFLHPADLSPVPRPGQRRGDALSATAAGQGRIQEQKTLSVKVPAGVDTGDRIRLAGEGEAGEHGGPPGDLYVEVHVKPHSIFQREDSHLYCEVPITVSTAPHWAASSRCLP